MFQHLKLTRPLAVFDLETTGTKPESDRIVEICIIKIMPDGSSETKTRKLNPTIPIPPEATAVHKITDADVANEPTFKQVAKTLNEYLTGCDLCGYNLVRFDLRLLRAEFQRVGIDFQLDGRAIIDPMMIYHKYEPRDLSAAARFYLNRDHQNAHQAEADVKVTIEILDAMIAKYQNMPADSKLENLADTPQGLQGLLKPDMAVDVEGKFRKVDDQIQFTFGQYRGQPLDTVAKNDPGFIKWMLAKDFHEDTKRVAREALERVQK
ncbi:MAG: 3'-5' exonuclease [Gemmataceae bacterium]